MKPIFFFKKAPHVTSTKLTNWTTRILSDDTNRIWSWDDCLFELNALWQISSSYKEKPFFFVSIISLTSSHLELVLLNKIFKTYLTQVSICQRSEPQRRVGIPSDRDQFMSLWRMRPLFFPLNTSSYMNQEVSYVITRSVTRQFT